MGRKIASGTFWIILCNAIAKGVVFFAMVLVARILGKASFGDFGLVRATAETIAVFEMGSSATKYMAEFLPSDKERVSRMIGLNYVFAFVSSVLVTSVFWLSVPRICDSILKAPHLAGGMRLGAVLLFCVTYSSFPDGVLAGFQDFRGLACSKLLSSLIAALVY